MKTIEQKMAEPFPVKSMQGVVSVKDIDMSKRTVTGYFNAYNYFDSDGDILLPGCAKKSIKERGPESQAVAKIKHALFHDLTLLPGKIQVLSEDETGLYFETRMSNTQLGNDTLINYQEKVYDNHSIGFRYLNVTSIDSKAKEWPKVLEQLINPKDAEARGYAYLVKEIMLWEGSTVAFGANQLTPYLGSKTMNREAMQMKLQDRMDILMKQVRIGHQSDEMLSSFELQIEQIKQMINELVLYEPETKPTIKGRDEDQHGEQVDISELVKNIKFF